MAKTHPPYAPEFRRQMVELIRSGRSARALELRPGVKLKSRWAVRTAYAEVGDRE